MSNSKQDDSEISHLRFDSVAESMRKRGVAQIRKYRCRIEEDGRFVMVSNRRSELEEAPLAPPDFWIPTGYVGEGWKAEVCVPDWMPAPVARDWYFRWKDEFAWPDERGEISDDPNDFIARELSGLRWMKDDNSRPKVAKLAATCADYLEQAMVDGYTLGGGFPPYTRASLLERETLDVKVDIARLIELAFRAGRLSARASLYYRGDDEVARKGKPHADRVGMGRTKRGFEQLQKWEQLVVSLLRVCPSTDRRELLTKLEEAGLATSKEGDKVILKGKKRALPFSSFQSAVSKLKSSYL